MKYLYFCGAMIFCGFVVYELFAKGSFDNSIAMWGAINFLMYEVEVLEEKIKRH